jgi:small subunit ribosomal protein S5
MEDNKRRKFDRREKSKYENRTVSIRRVAKVTAGAKRLRFSAIVVAGDRNGSVGVGLGRGVDTRSAVMKGTRVAEKNMTKIEVVGDTIPHEVVMKYGAARVLLRPARPGTGVIAGPSARAVLELAGIENVYAKLLGTSNLIANTYCTFEALKSLRNDRVLRKMKKMQARIGLKEEMDKERKKREMSLKKKKQTFTKKTNINKTKKDATRVDNKKKK